MLFYVARIGLSIIIIIPMLQLSNQKRWRIPMLQISNRNCPNIPMLQLSNRSDGEFGAAILEPEAIEKSKNSEPEPSILVLTTDSNNSGTECIFVLSERMADGTCVYEVKPHFQSKSNCMVPDSASSSASVQLNSNSDALSVGVDVNSDSDATLGADSEIESRPAESRGRKRVHHENQWKQHERSKKRNSGQSYISSRGKKCLERSLIQNMFVGAKQTI